jgi:glycosyltransferase involved in cell wall biosynthesis
MSEPTFSVVMPAYNAGATIEAAIRSVLGQTRSDLELLVVDDGSTDDTAARVERFFADGEVRLLRQRNTGPGAARNAAIVEARGSYVTFLDSDDLWLPDYLETMHRTLEADPAAGLAFTGVWFLDERTRRIHPVPDGAELPRPPRDPEQFLLVLLERNFVRVPTVRRRVLDHVGGFNPSLWIGEDYELWLRIVAAGYPAVRAPGVHHIYRDRTHSLSRDVQLDARCLREVYRLVAEQYDVSDEVREKARARARALDRKLALVEKGRVVFPMLVDARRRLRRWRRRRELLPLHEAPPEVAAAYPDLCAL